MPAMGRRCSAVVTLALVGAIGWGSPATARRPGHPTAEAAAGPASDHRRPAPAIPPPIRRRLGDPVRLGRATGSLAPIARAVIARVRRSYGADPSAIPVYLVSDRELGRLEQRIDRRDSPVSRLRGFEFRGVVYVAAGHLELEETLVHEVLHALSQRFAAEAQARGLGKLVEGTTQYLTMQTGVSHALKQHGFRRRGTAYGMYARFARHLADLVGDDVLARCYLGGGYAALERAVDRRIGAGRMARAARRLEADDMSGALAALGPAAREPFDAVWLSR